MSRISCRLLPYAVADGAHNMAADEVLLERAAAGVASLRCYGWSEATLSLGYFQPERLRHDDVPGACLAGLPFVRRHSGGAALVHHHEVTYALALPAGPPWQTGESWLCRMHAVIAAAVQAQGVEVQAIDCPAAASFTGTLCFQHLTAGDLVLGAAKIVGSAQRRQRAALMQHGVILLAASPYARALLGIRERSGLSLTASETVDVVTREFARQTDWDLVPSDWTPLENQRIAGLVTTKYTRDAWNYKR
jgi:lipoate-protein ligase A